MNYRECRTYSDLLKVKPFNIDYNGNCCACHAYGVEVRNLSTRANMCLDCIAKKGDAVLGSVVKAERKARSWIKNHPHTRKDPNFLRSITGASMEFIKTEIAKAEKAERAAA